MLSGVYNFFFTYYFDLVYSSVLELMESILNGFQDHHLKPLRHLLRKEAFLV